MEMKTCTKCGNEFPATLEYFYKYKNGLTAACKECRKGESKRHYQENKEKHNQYSREWAIKNKDKRNIILRRYRENNIENVRKSNREWQKKNPEKLVIQLQRRRTRKYNTEGIFTKQDVLDRYASQFGMCFYCGISLENKYHVDHYIPLSKGGNNKPENIVIACPYCNWSKNNKLPEEFMNYLIRTGRESVWL